jgi:hypothetical protein
VTASRSLASALYEGALVRGLLRPGPEFSCREPLDRQSQSPLIMHPDPHGRHRAGVRLQIGILSGFASEWWPASNRNTWPDSSESAILTIAHSPKRDKTIADRVANSPQQVEQVSPMADPTTSPEHADTRNTPYIEPWGPVRAVDW